MHGQTQALKNIEAVLKEAGSGLDKLVKVRMALSSALIYPTLYMGRLLCCVVSVLPLEPSDTVFHSGSIELTLDRSRGGAQVNIYLVRTLPCDACRPDSIVWMLSGQSRLRGMK